MSRDSITVLYAASFPSVIGVYMAPDVSPWRRTDGQIGYPSAPLPQLPFTTFIRAVPCPTLTEERCRQIIREELAWLDEKAARVAQLEKLLEALGNAAAALSTTSLDDDKQIVGEHIKQLQRELQQLKGR